MDHTLSDFLMGADRLPWIANNNSLNLCDLAHRLMPEAPLIEALEALARLRARFIAIDARAAALVRLTDLAATATKEETARKAATDLIKLSLIIERDQPRDADRAPQDAPAPRLSATEPQRLGDGSIDNLPSRPAAQHPTPPTTPPSAQRPTPHDPIARCPSPTPSSQPTPAPSAPSATDTPSAAPTNTPAARPTAPNPTAPNPTAPTRPAPTPSAPTPAPQPPHTPTPIAPAPRTHSPPIPARATSLAA